MKKHQNGMDRRTFLRLGLTGAAAAGLPSVLPGAAPTAKAAEAPIIRRTLGRTGITLPVVSMGVMNADNPRLVEAALEAGMVHLDTAHLYQQGRNETMLGEVLKGRKRGSFVIATKVPGGGMDRSTGLFSAATSTVEFMNQFSVSLKRLQMEYVDLLYLHNISKREAALYEPLLKALETIRKSGRARFVGVTTHRNEPEVIRAAVESRLYDVVLTAYNFRQEHRDEVRKAMEEAAKAGLGVIVMKTQAGVYWDKARTKPIDMAAALKWSLQSPAVCTAIPGFTTFDQLKTDAAVLRDLTLTQGERTALEPAAQAGLYCQGCGRCARLCPRGLPLPDAMRGYMYAFGYRNRLEARDLLLSLDLPDDPCEGCTGCTAHCARGIDVRERLAEVLPLRSVPEAFVS